LLINLGVSAQGGFVHNSCDALTLFVDIESLIKKLSDKQLSIEDDKLLRGLLDKYWSIDCPSDASDCLPSKCPFADREDWIEYYGYTSLADLLNYFEYEDMEILQLKGRSGIDTMNAHWARRSGHFNP
jgi:hypothetical protein